MIVSKSKTLELHLCASKLAEAAIIDSATEEALNARIDQFRDLTSDNVKTLLKQPIQTLDLSTRAINCLIFYSKDTIGKILIIEDLIQQTCDSLFAIKNLGETTLYEIRYQLYEKTGLTLLGDKGFAEEYKARFNKEI